MEIEMIENQEEASLESQIENKKSLLKMFTSDVANTKNDFRALFGQEVEYYKPSLLEKGVVEKFKGLIKSKEAQRDSVKEELQKLQDSFYQRSTT